jgi:calcineurin-like phosphoesterase
MRPVNCPFEAVEQVLEKIPTEVRIRCIDLHAEATSDKQAMGYFLDGRVSSVLGTHTHVTTADEQILPNGTAFQCDIGMTGAYRSILGREIQPVLKTTLTFDPNTFHVATEDVRLAATWVDVDPVTGLAKAIGRLQWKSAGD